MSAGGATLLNGTPRLRTSTLSNCSPVFIQEYIATVPVVSALLSVALHNCTASSFMVIVLPLAMILGR